MHLLVTWPLAVLAFCLGLFRKSQKGREVGRRGSVFSSDYYLSPWSSGCVLAPSGCWKPSPESSSFLEAFKGNTFSVYFCPFFFPLLASSQFALLATSLRRICAPVIHEFFFFSLAQQSHAGYMHVCVHGGCAGSERQKKTECWGGKGREGLCCDASRD